jgi:uncharacterized membrane protein
LNRYGKLFIAMIVCLLAFLIFTFYKSTQLQKDGLVRSSEVIATLPLVIQANVSLLAFWGVILVFRIRELSSTITELVRNLWEIGFKRDELRVKIIESREDKEKKDLLMQLSEELGKDAEQQEKRIRAFYDWKHMTMYTGLLPAIFFIASVSSGIYGISMTFHTEMVDQVAYFIPIVLLFTGMLSTIVALFGSAFEIVVRIRQ